MLIDTPATDGNGVIALGGTPSPAAPVSDGPDVLWLDDFEQRFEKLHAPEPYQRHWFEMHVNPSDAQMRAYRDEAAGDSSRFYCKLIRAWSLRAPLGPASLDALPDELYAWLIRAYAERRSRPLVPPTPSASASPTAPTPG